MAVYCYSPFLSGHSTFGSAKGSRALQRKATLQGRQRVRGTLPGPHPTIPPTGKRRRWHHRRSPGSPCRIMDLGYSRVHTLLHTNKRTIHRLRRPTAKVIHNKDTGRWHHMVRLQAFRVVIITRIRIEAPVPETCSGTSRYRVGNFLLTVEWKRQKLGVDECQRPCCTVTATFMRWGPVPARRFSSIASPWIGLI